ncbi:MAG: sulfate adenylyltransferase subunit CysN [Deferrisomatales bacterium]
MDLLRFSTAGSVDDGKSTLIGRLLYDTKAIFEDQLDAARRATRNPGAGEVDLSLLTDGLKAEREQGITIDVAYRYFATPRRKFIIADTPGHEQYTRNMATGASTADLAVVLVDARAGVLVQSKRHTAIAHLLGIPHLVVAVNKMDLVGYDRGVFEAIRRDFEAFAGRLGIRALTFIPLSALAGDNVVHRSDRMPWYRGPALLEHLEGVEVARNTAALPFRLPVQLVLRPNQDFRGFAGTVASGSVRVGDEVVALPSGRRSRVRGIHTHGGPLPSAVACQAVTLLLEDEIDVSRGDLLAAAGSPPTVAREFEADLVWMGEAPLDPARPYLVRHTTRATRGRVAEVLHRTDVNTLERVPARSLGLNEIGRVRLTTAQPLCADPYAENRTTGAFVLVDLETNHTVAAGMLR